MDRRLIEAGDTIRVRVHGSKCDGQGVCSLVSPGVFELDRYGLGLVRAGRDLLGAEDADRQSAFDAEGTCPRMAILIERSTAAASRGDAGQSSDFVDWTEPPPAGRDDAGLILGLAANVDEDLAMRVSAGGFRPVDRAKLARSVEEAALAGQGGAWFPAWRKWQAALLSSSNARQRPILVMNATEREPGTVKDRYLLLHRPYLVLDGAMAAATAIDADRLVFVIDADAEAANESVRRAVWEASSHGYLKGVDVRLETVPACYVSGEETAVMAALQGAPAVPTMRPPYPVEAGLYGRPTVVHNVETLAYVALIAQHGPGWFSAHGVNGARGPGLFSIGEFGADARSFRVFELPLGYSLRALLKEQGYDEPRASAVLVGGYSGGFVRWDQTDVALTRNSLAAIFASLGTKSIQVLPEGMCTVTAAAMVARYFASETALQCRSCYLGLPDLAGSLEALRDCTATMAELEQVKRFLHSLPGRGLCRLPDGAVRIANSLFENFEYEVVSHLAGTCTFRTVPDSKPLQRT